MEGAKEEKRIGNYILGRTIGKGRFSVVKVATHALTRSVVAMKIVLKESLPAEDLRVLVREMQIMKLLDHPNIVKLYEVINTKNAFCLVLEYVEGKTLGEIIENAKRGHHISSNLSREWVADLSDAVSYCHSKYVCHRDIKPDNILISSAGVVKLADFGFSNISSDLFDTHCGTPYFAAPELFCKDPYFGPSVDVWALGVLLYLLSFGRLPFDGDKLRAAIAKGEYTIPFSCDAKLKNAIKCLLDVNPAKRLTASQLRSHPYLIGRGTKQTIESYSTISLCTPEGGPIDFDEDVLKLMDYMGFDTEEVYGSVAGNKFDQVAAIYSLLCDSEYLVEYKLKLLQTQLDSRQTSSVKTPGLGAISETKAAQLAKENSTTSTSINSVESDQDTVSASMSRSQSGEINNVTTTSGSTSGSNTPRRRRSRSSSITRVFEFLRPFRKLSGSVGLEESSEQITTSDESINTNNANTINNTNNTNNSCTNENTLTSRGHSDNEDARRLPANFGGKAKLRASWSEQRSTTLPGNSQKPPVHKSPSFNNAASFTNEEAISPPRMKRRYSQGSQPTDFDLIMVRTAQMNEENPQTGGLPRTKSVSKFPSLRKSIKL